MRIVVTGGAGFIGSHVCERLIDRGDEVVCVDDFSSGRAENVAALLEAPGFEFLQQDVSVGLEVAGPVNAILHLASPASPPDYLRRPLETLAAGSRGTENVLRLTRDGTVRFVLASTSEVYGDPLVHPQREDYWGNVNPIGPRSVYDEAKRYAEAVTTAYRGVYGSNTGIVRIFNTYGPRMRADDGRVVSSFLTQALVGEPLTIYGDGTQTRSFCYVDDMVDGLLAMLASSEAGPVNLGNPQERTVSQLAGLVRDVTGCTLRERQCALPVDDPARRNPDISRARLTLGWVPRVGMEEGLRRTAAWFASRPDEVELAAVALRSIAQAQPLLTGARVEAAEEARANTAAPAKQAAADDVDPKSDDVCVRSDAVGAGEVACQVGDRTIELPCDVCECERVRQERVEQFT